MGKIRFGLIGCGNIAHIRYFYAFDNLDTIELAGIYDKDEEFLKATSKEIGVKAFASYGDMLNDPSIDAIIVTTYHPTHAELTIQALKAGKHVITEKPIATSVNDALLIKQAAAETDKIYMALPDDAYPPVEKVKTLLKQGVIGQVCSIDGYFGHHGPLHAPWFFDYDRAEWGVLADLGVYPISTLTYLFGPVGRVSGEISCLQKTRISEANETFTASVEDNIAALLAWPDGKFATIRSNWCTVGYKDDSIWDFRIYGSEGIIYLDMMLKSSEVVVYLPDKQPSEAKEIKHLGKNKCFQYSIGEADMSLDLMNQFVEAIKKNQKMPDDGCSIVRQSHVIEIIDKIYQSAKAGKMLELTTRF